MQNSDTKAAVDRNAYLAEEQYFRSVIDVMTRGGYEMFSRVSIDSDDHKYHVSALYARVTSLFFRLRGRKLIVQMAFYENIAEGGRYSCHWGIRAYMVFKPLPVLIEMTYDPDRSLLDESTPLDDIPIYRKDSTLMPGRRFGGSSSGEERHIYYEVDRGESFDSGGMARAVMGAMAEVEKYICGGPFKRLQVTSFPPYYAFPKSPATFWQRFDVAKLRQIVLRPWGCEGLD